MEYQPDSGAVIKNIDESTLSRIKHYLDGDKN